jgi:hypothetical protein
MRERRACTIHLFPERVDIIVPGRARLFRKTPPDTTSTFLWEEVTRIFVFKRDAFTVDLICMAFELNGAQTIEINENMDGWKELADAVPVYLPGTLTHNDWFQKVAFPAFALCWTQIYTRTTETRSSDVAIPQ